MSIKREQFSQARRIHGGLFRFFLAVLGVDLCRIPIPWRRLRGRLFRDFCRKIHPPGLNEQESELPLDTYRSLNAVFTRGIKPEYRPIPLDTSEILSPCDGEVQDIGRVDGGKILTVKGIEYSLASLLPGIDIQPYEGGRFVISFLSPIDCHRVFSPWDGRLEDPIHVPGYRLLVHPPFQRPEYPVYTLNERVIFRLTSDEGSCVVVMVAGWGVGNITMPLAPGFRPGSKRLETHVWDSPPEVKRGDWIATFELGSTVVLIVSSSYQAIPLVSPNEEVRYGQPVLEFSAVARPLGSTN